MGGAQILPDQPGSTTLHVQEAECVSGATVSLDELTLQPDFLYNVSELDDGSGSDPPPQSMLPQRSEY